MGSLRQRRKGGSWELTYELPRGADGKRKQGTKTVPGSKKEAKMELARIEQEIHEGIYIGPSKMNLANYLDIWLKDYAKVRVNPKTYQEYELIIKSNIVPALGHIPLSKLRPLHIQEYYSNLLENGSKIGRGGLSPKTVLNHHRLLHCALGQAIDWQLLATNPSDGATPPTQERKEMNTLAGIGMARLLQSAKDTSLFIPILIAISTGARRGEIVALTWNDLDFDTGVLKVTKSFGQTKHGVFLKSPKTSSGYRSVALPPIAVDFLRHHKKEQAKLRLRLGPAYQDENLICTLEDGSVFPPNRLTRRYADFIKRLGIPHVRLHDLRHSVATLLADEKINTKVTAELLGHSDPAFTMRQYVHSTPDVQREAAELIGDVLQSGLKQVQEGG